MKILDKVKEIPLSQGLVALVDDKDFERLNRYKWHVIKGGSTFYVVRNTPWARGKRQGIYMHREILQTPNGMHTDHINHDGLDNRRSNLRICTHQQNHFNEISQRGSTSQFKGVSWNKGNRKWQSHIKVNGQKKHLGYFNNEAKAAKAYDSAASSLFGGFAGLNIEEVYQKKEPAK